MLPLSFYVLMKTVVGGMGGSLIAFIVGLIKPSLREGGHVVMVVERGQSFLSLHDIVLFGEIPAGMSTNGFLAAGCDPVDANVH